MGSRHFIRSAPSACEDRVGQFRRTDAPAVVCIGMVIFQHLPYWLRSLISDHLQLSTEEVGTGQLQHRLGPVEHKYRQILMDALSVEGKRAGNSIPGLQQRRDIRARFFLFFPFI